MSQTKAQLISDLVQALAFTATSSAPDNGLYLSAANTLSLATNSIDRITAGTSELVINESGASVDFRVEGDTDANLLFVDASADRIGVGTSSPGSLLHVSGASAQLKIQNTTASLVDITQIDLTGSVVGSGAGNERSILFGRSDEPGRQAKIAYSQNNSNGQSPLLSFFTGDSASDLQRRMIIDSSGRVGINDDAPSKMLEVRGAQNSSEGIRINEISDTYHDLIASGGDFFIHADSKGDNGAANVLRFGVGSGGERARIDSSGRLGIGTQEPGSIVDIRQTQTGGETQLRIYNTDNDDTTTQTASIGLSPDSRAAATAGIEAIKVNADFSTNAGRDVALALNTTLNNAKNQAVYINHAGNVGIGTASPVSSFHVNSGTTDLAAIVESSDANVFLAFKDGDTTGNQQVQVGAVTNDLVAYAGGTEKARIDSSGRLLVGTIISIGASTDARETIQAVDSSGPRLLLGRNDATISADNTIGQIQFRGNADGTWTSIAAINCNADGTHATSDKPTRLSFLTTPSGSGVATERMRIRNDGASQFFSSTNTTTVRAVNGSSSGTDHRLFYGLHSGTAVNNGTAIYSIFTNGTVGTPSDIRLKKNVESTRDGYLDDIANLRVVKYHWKTQDDTEPKELGLIAQEVEQVFPGLIRTEGEGDDEVKEIKRSVIPFMLLKALQEANSKIEAQQVVINDLLARVTALEAN